MKLRCIFRADDDDYDVDYLRLPFPVTVSPPFTDNIMLL